MCGGTAILNATECELGGLSPRVRGNPVSANSVGFAQRSIPACAGEPDGRLAALPPVQVYPRVCGGTGFVLLPQPVGAGLSPRVRGNQRNPRRLFTLKGSIPACAGEPAGLPGR